MCLILSGGIIKCPRSVIIKKERKIIHIETAQVHIGVENQIDNSSTNR